MRGGKKRGGRLFTFPSVVFRTQPVRPLVLATRFVWDLERGGLYLRVDRGGNI